MKTQTKKGIQLNQAFGAILTLVLVAVLVIIALVVFVSLNTSFAGTSALTEINESLNLTSGSATVGNASLCSFDNFAVSIISFQNDTANTTINVANYTTTTAGVVTNTTAEFDTGFWLTTWTGTWGSEACTAGEDMTTEFASYTSLIGLLGTIIFLGLVIGVLVASFAFGGRREG